MTSGANIYYNNGNIGIGTSNPTFVLDISGNQRILGKSNVTSCAISGTLDVSGNSVMAGSVTALSFTTTSDYRAKKNVVDMNDAYNVDALRPVEYDINGKHDMGFLAHEVQSIFPFLVVGDKDSENIQSLNYNGLIALLVKEIQQLKNEIKILKKHIV